MNVNRTNRIARLVLLAALAAVALGGAVALTGCKSGGGTSQSGQTQTSAPATAPAAATVTKLQVKDLTVGKGAAAKPGDTVTVNYTGWLLDGTKFDSSYDHNQPYTFQLGAGQVIPGWDQGVVGMQVGGKRELIIPSDLAYGSQGSPPAIPPDAPLKFEVVMVKIQPAK